MSTTTQKMEKPLLQGQDWSGAMGEKWNQWHAQFEAMLAPIGKPHWRWQPADRVSGCLMWIVELVPPPSPWQNR